jgi:hypothetical protein
MARCRSLAPLALLVAFGCASAMIQVSAETISSPYAPLNQERTGIVRYTDDTPELVHPVCVRQCRFDDNQETQLIIRRRP